MKDKLIQVSAAPITSPGSTVIWAERVNAWTGAGIVVKNTGANPFSMWIATRQTDSGLYAVRPVEDLVNIPAGEARAFDADISLSQWMALYAIIPSGSSTADIDILLTAGSRPW